MNKTASQNQVSASPSPPEGAIVATVLEAVVKHRLPAGTKLSEQALSELFDCNRANVRRALTKLSAQHVVEILPNRGAFVAMPSPKEAREVFEARRTIEGMLAPNVIQHATSTDIADLRRLIQDEATAQAEGDKPRELRLSRAFHMRLARISGNSVLERFLTELTLRTTLILGLYGVTGVSSCAEDEHSKLVDAIAARDEAGLIARMMAHLQHLEADLDFSRMPLRAQSLGQQLML